MPTLRIWTYIVEVSPSTLGRPNCKAECWGVFQEGFQHICKLLQNFRISWHYSSL